MTWGFGLARNDTVGEGVYEGFDSSHLIFIPIEPSAKDTKAMAQQAATWPKIFAN